MLSNLRSPRLLQTASFLAVALLLAMAAAWTASGVHAYAGFQMDFDEAVHATRGLEFASALRAGDPAVFWQQLTRPDWYPPGHGLLLGVWLLLSGPGIETARLYATLWYVLLGLVLWCCSRQVLPGANPLLYLTAPLLLVADGQHGIHAALSMLELPAIVPALAALFFYGQYQRTGKLWAACLAQLSGLLALFTKYNFGLVVFAVIGLCDLWRLWQAYRTGNAARTVRIMLISWAPSLIIFILWFGVLGHWRWLLAYSEAQPETFQLWSAANFLYYPRLVWREPGGRAAILLAASAAIGLLRPKARWNWLTPYILFSFLSLVLITLELQKIPRFGMQMMPGLWLLAAGGAAALVEVLPTRWWRAGAVAVLLVGLAWFARGALLSLPSRLGRAYENTGPGVQQAYEFVAAALDANASGPVRLAMYGRSDQWNGPALRFFLVSHCMRSRSACDLSLLDNRELRLGWPPGSAEDPVQKEKAASFLAAANFMVIFSEEPELPAGWDPVAAGEFTFERLAKKPVRIQVVVAAR